VTSGPLEIYLQALASGAPSSSYLEIRYRVADQVLAAEFVPAHDRGTLIAAIRQRARGTDVYVVALLGFAARARRATSTRSGSCGRL
jgi:hypothetical protein